MQRLEKLSAWLRTRVSPLLRNHPANVLRELKIELASGTYKRVYVVFSPEFPIAPKLPTIRLETWSVRDFHKPVSGQPSGWPTIRPILRIG
jgi:hypothetical protein